MNKVILMGRLTKDPDIRYSQGATPTAVARYTLAVDRRFAKRDDPNAQTADFISCVTFGKSAEFAERYLKKGTKIAASGRIQTGSYTNKEGQKVYTTEVVVEDQEFAESKNAQGGGNQPNYANNAVAPDAGYQGFAPAAGANEQGPGADPFITVEGADDELPFH